MSEEYIAQFQYLKELSYRKTEGIMHDIIFIFQYLKELSYRKTRGQNLIKSLDFST